MHRLYPFIFPLILVALTSLISYLNYTPGTFLTGWDTLHPEFNFQKQFSNIIYGVFRTDQGLGAIAAHSHMSELPRVLFLWAESIFLPLSFLRYSYVFLCLTLGPLGIFYFVKKVLSIKHQASSSSYSEKHIHTTKYLLHDTSAFLAALFYLFNLGTVQHFIVPFEMFTTQYAALPWLFLTAFLFLQKPNAKRLLIFSLVSFLSSPMAYAAVLWYTYALGIALFLITYLFLNRTKKNFKNVTLLLTSILFTNAYWLFPNWYFLVTSASSVSDAQTNKLFSDEAFLHNKQYGTFLDTALFKNFLFNWNIQKTLTSTEPLLLSWRNHLANPFVIGIGYMFFAVSILGIILSFVKKNKVGISLLPVFLLSFIMIINMNPPFELLFSYLRENYPLFREGLRFPFTKFSILLMFSASVFYGIAINEVLSRLKKIKFISRKFSFFFLTILFSLISILYCLPMFSGNLIHKNMRSQIPNAYFKFFTYMKMQPENARVAPLPIHSLWGWEYYDWPATAGTQEVEYQGAGFLWFGISQPLLARDFDRWNSDNEQYFREMSNAIYSRDPDIVEALAEKYNITYFILDEDVIFPGNKQNALWHYETEKTFEKSNNIQLVQKFGDNLKLYKYQKGVPATSFVQSPKTYGNVGPALTGGFLDVAASKYNTYIYEKSPLLYYPARNFVNRYNRINPENIILQDGILTLKVSNSVPEGYEITHDWLSSDIYPDFMIDFDYDLSGETLSLPYKIGSDLYAPIATVSAIQPITTILQKSSECGEIHENSKSEFIKEKNLVKFKAKNSSSCGYINFPSEKQDFGNILMLEVKNVKGLPIRLCVTNKLTRKCDIYTSLDYGNVWKKYYFMVPPQPSGDVGYAVHFNTVSIGNTESINEVRKAYMVQAPYYRIQNLSFARNNNPKPFENGLSITNIRSLTPDNYLVSYKKTASYDEGLIMLSKAYNSGWQAYLFNNSTPNTLQLLFPFFGGEKILNHLAINNWANGWIIDNKTISNGQSIVIIFLPRYLQYAGFLLLLGYTGVLVIIGLKSHFKSHQE